MKRAGIAGGGNVPTTPWECQVQGAGEIQWNLIVLAMRQLQGLKLGISSDRRCAGGKYCSTGSGRGSDGQGAEENGKYG